MSLKFQFDRRINLVSTIYISAGKFCAFVQNNTDFVTRQHDMSHVLLSLLGGSWAKFRTYLGNLLSRSEFAFNLSPRVCRLNNLFLLIHRVPLIVPFARLVIISAVRYLHNPSRKVHRVCITNDGQIASSATPFALIGLERVIEMSNRPNMFAISHWNYSQDIYSNSISNSIYIYIYAICIDLWKCSF